MKDKPVTLVYSQWSGLPQPLKGSIGACEDCAYTLRRITLCASHAQAVTTHREQFRIRPGRKER
jgi:hypothetical protein